MSDPITIKELKSNPCEYVDRQYTYDELLSLFEEEGNLVVPLVRRCIQYEAEIERLRTELAAVTRTARKEIERLRSLLNPECPGCGLRPNLEGGAIVWCDECRDVEIERLRECLAEAIAVMRECEYDPDGCYWPTWEAVLKGGSDE